MPRLFCLGAGYSAQAVIHFLQTQSSDWSFAATARQGEKAAALAQAGIEPLLIRLGETPAATPPDPASDSLSREALFAALAQASHWLISLPPDQNGDPLLGQPGAAAQLQEALTASGQPGPRWIGVLSTIGVYGDRQGGWVDEDTPPDPASSRSARRLQAEAQWLELGRALGTPVHLLRLGGIYGPGRTVLDDIRAGTARRFDKPGQMFNRIYIDDIVACVVAAMTTPAEQLHPGQTSRVYTLCDNEPAAAADVIGWGCALLGVEPPPLQLFDSALLSPMARAFWSDNRKVSNRRLREELGVTLSAPTYREGLAKLLQAEKENIRHS